MTHHTITGGGGVRLHLVETGNPAGHPVLFLHGASQCCLSWSRQLGSDLTQDYRLVAMDMRGHGESDKPRDGYGDPRAWADDIRAAIDSLALKQPVLCGWSYGPLLALDYIRHYGDESIGGLCIVGAVTKLGSDDANSVLTPEFLSLVPGFFATDTETSVAALRGLLELCFAELPAEEMYTMLGFGISVPAYVRQALFARSFDNDDLMPTIRKPVMIVHGTSDRVVIPSAAEKHRASFGNARLELVPAGQHGLFWDDADTFNRMMRAFLHMIAPNPHALKRTA